MNFTHQCVFTVLLLGLALSSVKGQEIQRLDSALDKIVAPDAKAERIATGFNKWTEAHKSAELHMYAKGGHGFGMRKHGLPTDHWIDRFADWLELQGFLKK